MHTITLKADDNFFKTLNELVSKLGTSRSSLIRSAVINYKEMLEKEQLKEQIRKASLKVRHESIQMTNEFENALNDGLVHV